MSDLDVSARIAELAYALNERAASHPIGRLQEIRKSLKGLSRAAASTIFTGLSIKDDYAFHLGGRPELQFNIGTEHTNEGLLLRHGVAFSLEASQSYPDIVERLRAKVSLFNEYMLLYPDLLPDMALWHHRGADDLGTRPPGPIPAYLVSADVFIFLGKCQRFDVVDLELILDDFDRLLPLYEFVESGGAIDPVETRTTGFKFDPGFVERKSSAAVSRLPKELNVSLRHTLIQKELYRRLVAEHGVEHVRAEQGSGAGTFVDAVVRRPGSIYWFYEIKTSASPRICIREAIGQLLEYAHWRGSPNVERLVVVGEGALNDVAREYLETLKSRFALPLEYEQCSAEGAG